MHKIRLQSLPEMEYLVDDKPYPRGELLLKGITLFSGYFKNPEKTREVIDDQGWMRVGDIGKLLPNGAIEIIDRVGELRKL